MATIKDVAARAGVSIATVSYVLNQSRAVRPATAARVRAAVEELGFAINVTARNLASKRSSILGLIISDILNPFFPEIIRAFQDQALLHGLETIVMYTNYDPQRTLACAQRLIGLRVLGVAVMTTEFDEELMAMLARQEICAVYMDHGKVERLTSNIEMDYAVGIGEAVGHLRQLGHARIGFIGGPLSLKSAQRRKQAFVDNIGGANLAEQWLCDADFTAKGGYEACSRIFSLAPTPTAIVTANDMMAIGALHWAMDHGLRIPEDFSLIGYDNISFTEYTQPALTTVDQPTSAIGRLAFTALWETIQDEERRGREYRLATHLFLRRSTAPPPLSSRP